MSQTQPLVNQFRETLSAAHLLATFHDANMPLDDQGRVYHLGCRHGDVANRVVSVGDPRRAALLATFLDDDDESNKAVKVTHHGEEHALPSSVRVIPSKRGFTTYTGTYGGVPVSIIATGMGQPMMDFLVRETRAVVDGTMLIVRLGTAGTPKKELNVGSMAVATAAVEVYRKSELFDDEGDVPIKSKSEHFYHLSKPCPGNAELSSALTRALEIRMKGVAIVEGLNATADSFYSSQGRAAKHFEDHNETLVQDIISKYPDVVSLEMETYQLFHLARVSKPQYKIHASAATILLANRITNAFAEPAVLTQRETDAGRAVLDAICSTDFATLTTTPSSASLSSQSL